MNRRNWIQAAAAAGGAFLAGPLCTLAQAADGKKLPAVRIKDIKTFLTAPAGLRLVVVKVETDEPGLYGLGCATFTQRVRVVETAVEKYLKPFLLGKDVTRIEDIWKSSFVSSYWRNGPVLNNAISGVDMALWDILGKRAGLPLYQLFGGKCRDRVRTYRDTWAHTLQGVEDKARKFMDEGYRHLRVQVVGLAKFGAPEQPDNRSVPVNRRARVWEPKPYLRATLALLEHLRESLGDEIELIHDVHERVPPIQAIQFAKDVEPYKLFFLEDPFSPEDIGYFKHLRAQTSTPIAMGELFNNSHEWTGLVKERLIDFIRAHVSQIGGITQARKMAAMCEYFGVRTAWHGPADVSPVGHAAHVHLDLATPNFGIQEAREFTDQEREVFPGSPELRDGFYRASDAPGLGIDLDEKAAARYPIKDAPPFYMPFGNTRRLDGTITKP